MPACDSVVDVLIQRLGASRCEACSSASLRRNTLCCTYGALWAKIKKTKKKRSDIVENIGCALGTTSEMYSCR